MRELLVGIEGRIVNHIPDLLPCDPWLSSSVMQKAIRRGDKKTALRAAVTLWQQDKVRFWRRLHITAIEDVGPAEPNAVADTLVATAQGRWRNRVGDLQVGLALVRSLCAAPKCRMADHVYIAAERGAGYERLRVQLASKSASALTDIALGRDAHLIERLLALWLLAGTKRYPSDYMLRRDGSLGDAIGIVRSLGVPADLLTSCEGVMMKTSWPLALFMPLLWAEVQKHPVSVKINSLLPVPDVKGVPICSVDWFTRTGRTSISQLQKAVPAIKCFSSQQVGLAAFYLEGGKVDRELTSPALDGFKQEGELADIESTGLDAPQYLGLLELMERHWPQFEEIRIKQLQRYQDDIAAGWSPA